MNAPAGLHSDAAAGLLTVHWHDGTQHALAHRRLRDACPCAGCRAQRRAGEPVRSPPGVTLAAIHPMGYGVQLVFSDGHARGIYPWPLLASLAAQRGAERSDDGPPVSAIRVPVSRSLPPSTA